MNEYIYLRAWCRLLGSFFNFIEGKGKTEDLQATGYLVDVYAPHGRNRRRAVVLQAGRRAESTAAEQATAERKNCVAFQVDTSTVKDSQIVDGFFVGNSIGDSGLSAIRGQRAIDLNWPLLSELENMEAAKTYIRGYPHQSSLSTGLRS